MDAAWAKVVVIWPSDVGCEIGRRVVWAFRMKMPKAFQNACYSTATIHSHAKHSTRRLPENTTDCAGR